MDVCAWRVAAAAAEVAARRQHGNLLKSVVVVAQSVMDMRYQPNWP